MSATTLQSLIDSSAGMLIPPTREVSVDALQSPVIGIELYQPGMSASASAYADRVVLILSRTGDHTDWAGVRQDCGQASALIVSSEPPEDLVWPRAAPLLRCVSWVTPGELLMTLAQTIRSDPDQSSDDVDAAAPVLEADAALAVRRQESALLLLLNGMPDAAVPAAMAGLRPDRDHVVLAAAPTEEHLGQYLLALRAEFPAERSVVSEGAVLTVLVLNDGQGVEEVIARLRSRLARALRAVHDLPVGVGSIALGVFTLHESAAAAREILRALRIRLGTPWRSDTGGLRVAGTDDVSDALALIRVADALRPLGASLAEPLMLLAEYDRDHRTVLLPSVLAALEYRHNATLAARQLGIHADSLRTRLERAKEISGVDVNDQASALRAMVGFLAFPEVHRLARPMP